jgi:hypothetical protein
MSIFTELYTVQCTSYKRTWFSIKHSNVLNIASFQLKCYLFTGNIINLKVSFILVSKCHTNIMQIKAICDLSSSSSSSSSSNNNNNNNNNNVSMI